ncbi:MAG: tRNA 2-selenouridine(34) synthase MnmH [Cyanobacteriota bacterium]
MSKAIAIDSFLSGEGTLLDVRTPSEFQQGHIPGARNLPLFSDSERAVVGTLYKQAGRQDAVRQGLAFAGPRMAALADALIAAQAAAPDHPLRLHCWRGGLRSGSVAWLTSTLNLPVVVLDGGYKAYRRWVLERMEQFWPVRLLGGRTGTGKTALLLALARRGVAAVDLEGLAHHRGSSFGGLGLPEQPSSEQFENRLAGALERHQGAGEIWLEAESAQVGRCRIPAGLWRQMRGAPVLEVRRPLQERLRHLVEIYGPQDPAALIEATRRIQKRLGPQRTSAAVEAISRGAMEDACALMLDYYDRSYDREIAAHAVTAVDLGALDPEAGADALIRQGLVKAP